MNLTTSTYQVKTGGTLTINAPATLSITGGIDLQNGSTFTLGQNATLNVSGNFNNSNNSTGVVVNGTVSVGGNLTSGNGSTVSSPTGTGSFTVSGSISGAGTVFGSSADCTDTSVPCVSNAASPLPVELIYLGIECADTGAELNWKTASEHNSDHFSIDRSRDGYSWENIGIVNSAGNSNQVIDYEFTDPTNPGGVNYYRITQVDTDGLEELFPIITADCELTDKTLSVFPNPVKEEAFIRIVSSKSKNVANLLVLDLKGNIMLDNEIELVEGNNVFPIAVSQLKTGMYIVNVVIQNEDQLFSKLIKE
jgi:hypothetical protein